MKYRLTYLLVLLLAPAGCDDIAAKLDAECMDNLDCAHGMVCHQESGKCLANVQIVPSVEVWPPSNNNQGWVAQEFINPGLGPDGKLSLRLGESVSMQGSVYASDKPNMPVPSRVVAWRDSKIKGRPRVQVETTVGTGGKTDTPKDYVMWLAPGHKYTFLIAPKMPFNVLYPPLVMDNVTIASHAKKDFVLEGEERTVAVKGKLVDAAGNAIRDDKVKIKDPAKPKDPTAYLSSSLHIWAKEVGGFHESTLAKTDHLTGAFSFRVPASTTVPATGRTYDVKVESQPGSIPMPTLTCTNVVLGIFSSAKAEQDLGSLRMPAFLMPKLFTWSVKGSDKLSKVAGATVTFHLAMDKVPRNQGFEKCTAYYQQTAITDATGKVTVMLLPGSTKNQKYQVTVAAPNGSPYASRLIKDLEVGSSGGVHKDIILDDRYELSGKVVGPDGKPVAGAKVEAAGIKSVASATVQPATTSATTDAKGIFKLFADSGNYNINVRPPYGAALPSYVMRNISVTGNHDDLLFKIPMGTILAGTVKQPGGKALGNARVEVYEQVYHTDQKTLTTTLRASDISASGGTFSLVLPAKTVK